MPVKPYNLQHDGDMWSIAHKAIVTRGAHTVAVTKVKGHAEWSECDTELKRTHKDGNDRADKVAKGAHLKNHGMHIVQLSDSYAERQR
eukprot:11959094-Karenia_brevis.AAC.1